MRKNPPTHGPVAAKKWPASAVRLVLAGPQRLTCVPCNICCRELSICQWIVHANDGDIPSEFGVFQNIICDGKLSCTFSRVFIATDDLGRETLLYELAVEFLDVGRVIYLLVPYPRDSDIEAMIALCGLNKVRDIVSHLGRVERVLIARSGIHPSWGAPRQNLEENLWIPLVSFGHEPPLVSPR